MERRGFIKRLFGGAAAMLFPVKPIDRQYVAPLADELTFPPLDPYGNCVFEAAVIGKEGVGPVTRLYFKPEVTPGVSPEWEWVDDPIKRRFLTPVSSPWMRDIRYGVIQPRQAFRITNPDCGPGLLKRVYSVSREGTEEILLGPEDLVTAETYLKRRP